MREDLYRILVKGGVLSPSELKQIADLVISSGLDYINFGSRQDILFPKAKDLEELVAQFPQFDIDELANKQYHNIVSGYVSADIFPATSWLKGTTYLYVLEQFRTPSQLKINIADPQQRLVPLFTGHLNFIASKHYDYWYLYLNLPGYPAQDYYPVLIHTWDIAKVAKAIEDSYSANEDLDILFDFISKSIDTNSRTIDQALTVPFYPFPYYEGMNRMGIDQYWLGLYWRNNKYDIHFLKAMCDLCLESRIGKICLTPWKSFIVKGIPRADKVIWEKFLGMRGLNVRHSSLELNWHLPVNDPAALDLKRFLVRNFDQNDISTYGLTFGIQAPGTQKFTSIVIENNPRPQIAQEFEIRPTYNVLHATDFDPNTLRYRTYAQDVDKIELPGLLMELSQLYFEQLQVEPTVQKGQQKKDQRSPVREKELHQCQDCFTVYDPQLGDALNGIAAGTPFEELPATFKCPTCEAPKQRFVLSRIGQVVSDEVGE